MLCSSSFDLGETVYAQRNGAYNLNLRADVNAPLASTDVLRLKNAVSYLRQKNVGYDDSAYENSVTENFSLVFQPSSSLELCAVGSFQYSGLEQKSSIGSESDLYIFNYGLTANIELPLGIQFGTDCMMYSMRGDTDEMDKSNMFLLNARLTKRFLNNRLLVQFTGYDLLGNVSVTDKTFDSANQFRMYRLGGYIPSYGMMNVTWRF